MPKYICPECEAVLKRSDPVPAGKKIKCPKCEFVFAPKAMREDEDEDDPKPKAKSKDTSRKEKAPPAPKPVSRKANDDDDDEDGGTYGVLKEEDKPTPEAEENEKLYQNLRDKFPKSKRGPAMALTVTPSNYILLLAMIMAIGSIVMFMWALWPFVFSEAPPKGSEAKKRGLYIGAAVLLFIMYCLSAYGASKMHSLESLTWAWIGSILIIVGCPVLGWAVGALAIITLQKQEVRDGFIETKQRANELKYL